VTDLTDKVVLITGAAQGIGREIAKRFLACGASVALADINHDTVLSTAGELSTGGPTLALTLNVADSAAVKSAVKTVLEKWGKIDVLINNAGITRDSLAMRMKDEDWLAVIDVNLTGAFNCARAVLRPMLKQKSGRIINIASIVGVIGNAGQANYAAAKAGLIGLTKTLAREAAMRGVLVNAIAPGFIDTAMTQVIPENEKNALLQRIPVGRLGTTDDIAATALFLASPEVSYITGQVLLVDGGMGM